MFVMKVKRDKVKVLRAKGTIPGIVANWTLAAAELHHAIKEKSPEEANAFIKTVQRAVSDESPLWQLDGHGSHLLKVAARGKRDA